MFDWSDTVFRRRNVTRRRISNTVLQPRYWGSEADSPEALPIGTTEESRTNYDVVHNNTWYSKCGIDQWKPYIGECIWKEMLFTEEICTFMSWYGTSPDLPLVIEFVYVFPLVKRHNISITRGRSTGVPYQRMKKPIILYKIKDLYSSTI